MQAVVKIGSSQYLVTPGQELLVDKLSKDSGDIEFDQILLLIDGDKVRVGQPYLTDIKVIAQVAGQTKGEKIRVFKFKAKSRYSKTTGFRAKLTKIKIGEIRVKKA